MKKTGQLKLLDEAQFLIVVLSVCIIIAVEIISLTFIFAKRIADLKTRSIVTANEISLLLQEPMYSFDDVQAKRIGEALLSSGEISGIKLESPVSGFIIDKEVQKESRWLPSQTRTVFRDETNVGTVRLSFNDDEILRMGQQFFQLTIAIVFAVLFSSFLVTRFILLRRVKKTFESIGEGINAIADGDYTAVIPLGRYRDVNMFIELVNDMAGKILANNGELQDANNLLEQRVLARTADLEKAQNRLVLSEKLSALGQLSAGIAHELNTPLGAISSSVGLLEEFFGKDFIGLVDLYAGMDNVQREFFLRILGSAMEEGIKPSSGNERKAKKDMQVRIEEEGISESRKLAEQMVEMNIAGMFDSILPVIHEPWFFGCISAVSKIVSAGKMTEIIQVGIQKAIIVVSALRSYLRDGPASSLEAVDIGSSIDTILTLIHNKTKNEVAIIRDYQAGSALGSPQSLGQVWLNIINNALQAMEYKGILTLKTERSEGNILVHIIDNGSGIPDEIHDRIFEPFFSTKDYADGMGLGLDICKRIVEQFGGKISFESRPGHTRFTVQLLPSD